MEQAANYIIGDDGCSFIEDVRRQAEWRAQKAVEYQEDDRNQRSSDALEELAQWIENNRTAPAVEALDEALDRLYESVEAMATFEPTISARLGRYGFNGPDDPEEWLSGLTKEINDHLPRRKKSRSKRGTAAMAKRPLRLVRSRV